MQIFPLTGKLIQEIDDPKNSPETHTNAQEENSPKIHMKFMLKFLFATAKPYQPILPQVIEGLGLEVSGFEGLDPRK